jgi:FAD/FMN-containing dehydrogenase
LTPPGFPADIPLGRAAWKNWAGEIDVENLPTAVARDADDVVRLANWALGTGWKVRARGMMHGWSPLGVPLSAGCQDGLLLVDTTQHLTSMEMVADNAVRVEAGATTEALLGFLESHGRGFTAFPAPGDITIGGALTIGAHGAAIPAVGEGRLPGHTYGSLSNLVVSLTAVVFDARHRRYRLRKFDRDHPDCKAFLTHLGRSFVTAVTLRAGVNTNVRCVSSTDISAAELFAPPATAGDRSFGSFMDAAGRVEAIWFPFTEKPWLKVWSVAPVKPAASRAVTAPYNYGFSDHIPAEVSSLAQDVIDGQGNLVPLLGAAQYEVSVAGLAATDSLDLWGPSKDVQLYIRPTTLRVTANGYAVMTARADIQRVVSDFRAAYLALLDGYKARGAFPANGPVEIRATGLDHPNHVGVRGAEAPALSALTPRHDRPMWDVAVWFDVLTLPGTPDAAAFMAELEGWFFTHFQGFAAVRPEWSKGWAYSARGAWTNTRLMRGAIRSAYMAGHRPGSGWDWARHTLNRYDPHRVFSNRFLEVLLP